MTCSAVYAGKACYSLILTLINYFCVEQLFYKTGRLRVVISTANLIAYDWRDMENVSFLAQNLIFDLKLLIVCLVTGHSTTFETYPT